MNDQSNSIDQVLYMVTSPTLLIIGENDYPVIDMNQEAFGKLKTEKKIMIVPGATHLFEERGALEVVARLAADWFLIYLTKKVENNGNDFQR